MSQETKPTAFAYAPESEFVARYIEREFSDFEVVQNIEELRAGGVAVMISSTEIYDVVEGMNYDENTPIKTESVYAKAEAAFREMCERVGAKPTILRCANIVGTGMNGLPMRLARGIARGTLCNIKGNEALINTVHAVDVARVAHLLAGSGETYNVTCGIDTPMTEFIDALSHRVKNKQVFTLGARWARLLYGGEYFGLMTTTLTFNNMRMVHALPEDFKFNDVAYYLKNHDYTNDTI